MATTSDTWDSSSAPTVGSDNYLTHTSGLASWVFTLDHKRVGIMFLASVVLCLFLTLPYSKFAHIMYRTLAMTHERMSTNQQLKR